jgi:hypothetical protein
MKFLQYQAFAAGHAQKKSGHPVGQPAIGPETIRKKSLGERSGVALLHGPAPGWLLRWCKITS